MPTYNHPCVMVLNTNVRLDSIVWNTFQNSMGEWRTVGYVERVGKVEVIHIDYTRPVVPLRFMGVGHNYSDSTPLDHPQRLLLAYLAAAFPYVDYVAKDAATIRPTRGSQHIPVVNAVKAAEPWVSKYLQGQPKCPQLVSFDNFFGFPPVLAFPASTPTPGPLQYTGEPPSSVGVTMLKGQKPLLIDTCKCPIKDLLSTGHNAGCPEKRG